MQYKFAGKRQQAREIVEEMLREIKPRIFVEPYVGSGIITLTLLEQHKPETVIINDLNPSLINRIQAFINPDIAGFEKWLNTAGVQFLLYLYRIRRQTLEKYSDTLGEDIVRTLVRMSTEVEMRFSRAQLEGYDAMFALPPHHPDNIRKLKQRWMEAVRGVNVRIYNQDAVKLLRENLTEYDNKETLIYLDPPYQGKGKWYVCQNDWEAMLETVFAYQNATIFLSNHKIVEGFRVVRRFEVRNFSQIYRGKINTREDYLLLKT